MSWGGRFLLIVLSLGILTFRAVADTTTEPVSDALRARIAPSLARLYLRNKTRPENRPCSGFVLRSGELLTCEHCVSDEEDCAAMVAEFETTSTRARCRKLLRVSSLDDIAVVELEWPTNHAAPEGLTLANRSFTPGHSVVVAGYPVELERALKFTSGKVLKAFLPNSINFFHDATTRPGNSGSPVIDPYTWEVVALHCASSEFTGTRQAYGARVERIRKLLDQ